MRRWSRGEGKKRVGWARFDDMDPCWRDKVASTQAKVVKLYRFSLSFALFVLPILRVPSEEVTSGIMVKN